MSFLHPWLLLGALGAAVPVLLHFFGRRRARRVPFSSLMLIQQAQRERSALMRVRQLLLMILRALAILLLSLAAAQPVLPLRVTLRDVAVVLDDTPSMRATDGLGLFRQAGGAPQEVLHAAARLVAGERRVRAVLLSEMASPSDAPTETDDLGRYRAMDNAPVLAAPGVDERTLVFFTDLQATSWLTKAALPHGREVVVVDCGRDTPNRSLLSVEPREPTVIAGRPTELVLTGRGTPGPVPLRLSVDGREVGSVSLNTGEEPTQAVFEWRPQGAGVKRVQAELPADAMPEDNVWYAAVDVRQRLRVLILGDGPAERLAALALAPGEGSPVEAQTVAALPATMDADVVIVGKAPTPAELAALKQAREAGLGLILLAAKLPVPVLRELAGDDELDLKPARPEPLHVGEFDVFRPPLRAFANPQAGDLRQPEFRQTPELRVRPTHWRLAARFEDGAPALAARQVGAARVLVGALTLDPQHTNLPQQPVFVPLMHRLAGFVARGPEMDPGSILVGQSFGLPTPDAEVMQVYDPKGKVLVGSPPGEALHANVPGFHRLSWTAGGQRHETLFAVNMDPREGDLRRTTPEHVRQCLPGKVSIVRPTPDGRVKLLPLAGAGLHLAGPLLAAVLVLLLVELALAQGLRLALFRRRGEA